MIRASGDPWADIDFEGRTIRWRAKHEKTGYDHRTPLTDEAVAVSEAARKRNPRERQRLGAVVSAGSLHVREPLDARHGPDCGSGDRASLGLWESFPTRR